MKAPKEIRQWINQIKKFHGKKNGVIPYLWDDFRMEIKLQKSKKKYNRKIEKAPKTLT